MEKKSEWNHIENVIRIVTVSLNAALCTLYNIHHLSWKVVNILTHETKFDLLWVNLLLAYCKNSQVIFSLTYYVNFKKSLNFKGDLISPNFYVRASVIYVVRRCILTVFIICTRIIFIIIANLIWKSVNSILHSIKTSPLVDIWYEVHV